MVAAMILGGASFGHKGVIFPLLVRGIGCVSDMISTFSVRAANKGGVKEAMASLTRGFRLGAILSTVGFLVVGFLYLRFGGAQGGITHLDEGYRALATAGVPAAIAVERCATLEAAVASAARHARPGDAVLLSPACASFDMFRDYRHRGEAFAAAVKALGA